MIGTDEAQFGNWAYPEVYAKKFIPRRTQAIAQRKVLLHKEMLGEDSLQFGAIFAPSMSER